MKTQLHQLHRLQTSGAWLVTSIALSLITLLHCAPSEAAKFQNAYVSFNLPDKWNCSLELTEWVCRTKDPGLAEALIVLTAKEAGPADSLPNYEQYLKNPRTLVTRSGRAMQSTVYNTTMRQIDGHPWIDSLHFSSEVYNYYTRYVVTKKDRVGVIVTFSAHKLQYTRYSQEFFNAIASLKVISEQPSSRAPSTNEVIGPMMVGDSQPMMDDAHPFGEGSADPSGKTWLRIIAVLSLVAGAGWALFVAQKRKRSKKKATKSKNHAA